jgi:Tfp pilus assembly protein PilV
MTKRQNYLKQRGFSILEVVIGIFVFVVGMMALAALQGALTRAMTDAKVRTTAASIAERTIERQRGFGRLMTDPGGQLFAYNDITSSSSWATSDNNITNSSSWATSDKTISANGVIYTIDQVVTDYYYSLAADGFCHTGEGCPTGALASTYKQVEVTVSWNTAQSFRGDEGTEIRAANLGGGNIKLTSMIPALVTSASALVMEASDSTTLVPPVTYTPGLNPDIVSLSLGDTKFKESLLPEPDVARTDQLVETRFDVITYSSAGVSRFLRREEFAAVSCECTLEAANADAPGRRPVIWAGDEYVRGQLVVKQYGVSDNPLQSDLCDTCCRDHHDGGSSAEDHATDELVNVFDPFKPVSEYHNESGNHRHYARTGQGDLVEVSTGQDYVEACRLVRQDGFFRVTQDFRRENINAFPVDFLDETDEIDVYSAFVTNAIGEYTDAAIILENSISYPTNPPCIGASPCTIPAAPRPAVGDEVILANGEFPSWTPLQGMDTQQLRSRGIYLDYLSDDLRTVLINCVGEVTAEDDDCKSGDVELDRTGSVNALEMIPFFDVQMTKLNRWNETPTNVPVDTTNEPLENLNAHSRGLASRSSDGDSDVVSEGHRGNLGFTDTLPVDLRYSSLLSHANLVVRAGSGSTPPPVGTVIGGALSTTISGNVNIIVTGLPGVLCGQTSASYSCTVSLSAGNPRLEISGFGKKNFDRYVCSTSTPLLEQVGAETVTSGLNAKAVFSLVDVAAGSDYDFVVQSDPCPLPPI